MPSEINLRRVSVTELDAVIEQAREERWSVLMLAGPDAAIPKSPPKNSFRLTESLSNFEFEFPSLPYLKSLALLECGLNATHTNAIAASLTGLTSLDLGRNDIGPEGAKAILNAWSSDSRKAVPRVLNLRDTTDSTVAWLKELFETIDAQAIIAAYERFQAAQASSTLRPLNELKLLVVGNEAVGKTSLLRYLIRNESCDPGESRTTGIVQHEKIEIESWSPAGCRIRLNVWDFGGQEMMRGTHRFFLTERSLYLLVLEDRRQDDRSIHEWVKTIRNRGGESPIIVVINKSDEGKRDLRLDDAGLREKYPNIAAFLRTSCNPGRWAHDSIAALRQKVVEIAMSDVRIRHVRDGVPDNWLAIKNSVEQLANRRSVLSHADFATLCKAPGDATEPIDSENEQRALLSLLNELGTVVAHGLERDAPATRREISLLDPNWLTRAVYQILDKARSVDQESQFSRGELAQWLDAGPYPPERHEFILDMMQDRDIGLCFKLPERNEERYLVPEALPASARFFGRWPDDSLRFRFSYGYLPPGLIPRFIVESHKNLTPEKSRWRTGVVLNVRKCPVLVTADPDKRQVDVQVDGPVT